MADLHTAIFAGRPISAHLANRIALLPGADRRRLEEQVRGRQPRRWIGGRELSAIFEDQLQARGTPGFQYYQSLLRIDRRAA